MTIEQLKREHDLHVLKIGLNRTGSPERPPDPSREAVAEVEFSLGGPWEVGEGPTVAFPLAELGIPAVFSELKSYWYHEPPYQLPSQLVSWLKEEGSRLGTQEPVWIHHDAGSGFLPCVPWERLLSPHLQRPMYRLPYVALNPNIDASSRDVVLCASVPAAKANIPMGQVGRTAELLVRSDPERTFVHVFVDEEARAEVMEVLVTLDLQVPLLRSLEDAAGGSGIVVHAPFEVESRSEPPRGGPPGPEPPRIQNPWLHWMLQALRGRVADSVHFISHGYLAQDRGCVALAESPTQNRDTRWARFVGPRELSMFLMHLGAWSIGFTSPPHNFSIPGLRLLADQLARQRPGPVFVLGAAHTDDKMEELGGLYKLMYGESAEHPGRPTSSLYIHPALVKGEASRPRSLKSRSAWLDDAMVELGLKDAMMELGLESEPPQQGTSPQIASAPEDVEVPTWAVAAQRYIEQSTMRSFAAGDEGTPLAPKVQMSPYGTGRQKALTFLADVLDRHAGLK